MAHELEIDKKTGEAQMFSVRETPWHGLGRILTEAPATADEAMKLAGLDWQVNSEPIYNRKGREIRSHKLAVRDRDGRELGVVSSKYRFVQNAKAFDFFDPTVQAGQATYETAGSLKGGRSVWVMCKLTGKFEPIAGDVVQPYVFMSNTHDGTRCVIARYSPVRIVCANTLSAALAGAATCEVRIRHTAGLDAKFEEAQRVMGLVVEQQGKTQEAFELMGKARAKDAQVQEFLHRLWPSRSDCKIDVGLRQRIAVAELMKGGRGTSLPGVQGSWWGAYNAATEYVDHHAVCAEQTKEADELLQGVLGRGTVRGGESRLASVLMGTGLKTKQKALELALGYAKTA